MSINTHKTQFDPENFPQELDRIHELASKILPSFALILSDKFFQENDPDFQELITILHELHPADMAVVLESLPLQERILIWKLAIPEEDGEVLLEVSDSVRETLIQAMDDTELLAAVADLDVDELAELAPTLPINIVSEVLESKDQNEQEQIRTVLSYNESQVGSIMDFELVNVRADISCEVVLRYLRRFETLPNHTDKIFIVDEDDYLQGVLPIRKLLISDTDSLVAEIMSTDVVKFKPTDDREEAAQAFEKYDLVTAPVVDEDNKLIGRLTVDEIVDVIREETDQDMLNMVGLQEAEDLFSPIIDSVKNRWVWLAINMCTAFIASRVIGIFEGSIEKIVALAALMPIVAGIGGNTGNQTITMIVRALSTGQISQTQGIHLLKKEASVALINGLVWGSIMGIVSYILYHDIGLSIVMLTAMTLNLILAACLGVLIPLTMEKLGRDPALGSSVMITAVTDSGGFFIFLGLASFFLLR